jgi:phosphoglycolate phosphatase-like HAD superfamily hydrolase
MIGDTTTDLYAARAVDVPFLGYARSEAKAKRLREAGAGVVVESMRPVLELVRRRRNVQA